MRPVVARNFTLKQLSLAIAAIVAAPGLWAAPDGGQVVAGQGVIEQVEKETRIQQASERLSIDWKSFDLNSDERVHFIQPNSSSIAFNRIQSNKGSLIQGRIDANGQVVLINPNGLIFTEGASVNAGGLIASALQMNDQDYLNGKYTLNALEGSEGRVINSGLLNAATGGNISLIGQSVENKGLISAQLGSVNLAAGKEAVLTFEPNGLVGVRVTEAVLQKDLGVDAAIINSGEIKAEGGKVLITASTSKEIFSKAVNVGELSSAKSAVVNDDGSFTLGAGADVVNTGKVSVSADSVAGEVVVIGENISNSGVISANSQSALAGHIEITAKNANEIRSNGLVTTVSYQNGRGGDIKILGDKVGLLDEAKVDCSGAEGGGHILVGGDKNGANRFVRNASFLIQSEFSEMHADSLLIGDGGQVIAIAEDTARIYGGISARGGFDGRGGFVETSGFKGFEIFQPPELRSMRGMSGTWLIDPFDVEINNSNLGSGFNASNIGGVIYVATRGARIGWDRIRTTLVAGGTVEIKTSSDPDTGTGGSIRISANFDFSDQNPNLLEGFDSTVILKADKNIETTAAVTSIKATNNNRLNLELNAKDEIILGATKIETNGGNFTAFAQNGNIISTGEIKTERATTSKSEITQSGAISVTAENGQATFNTISSAGYSWLTGEGDGGNAGTLNISGKLGVTVSGTVSSAGGFARDDIDDLLSDVSSQKTGGNANKLTIISDGGNAVAAEDDGFITLNKLDAGGGNAGIDTETAGTNTDPRRGAAAGGNAEKITLTAKNGVITLNGTTSNTLGLGTQDLGFSFISGDNGAGAGIDVQARSLIVNTSGRLETGGGTIDIVADNITLESGASIHSGKGSTTDYNSSDSKAINEAKFADAKLFVLGGDVKINTLNAAAIELKGTSGIYTHGGNLLIGSQSARIKSSFIQAPESTLSTFAPYGGGDVVIYGEQDITLGSVNFSRYFNSDAVRTGSLLVDSQGSIKLGAEFNYNDTAGYNSEGVLPSSLTVENAKTTLTFLANNNITLDGIIRDNPYADNRDTLGIALTAANGTVALNQAIYTGGGSIDVSGAVISQGGIINTERANERTTVDAGNGQNGNAKRSEGGNVTFRTDADITLNAITTDSFCTTGTCTGNLMVQSRTANQKINVQQAINTPLTIHGTTTLNTFGGAITLDAAGNTFGTQGGATESAAQNPQDKLISLGTSGPVILNGQGLLLDTASITGDANFTAAGKTIAQGANSKITITGNATLAANNILLTNANNDFATIDSLTATASASLVDANGLTINTLNTPDFSFNSSAEALFNGVITASANRTITQSGTGGVALGDSLSKSGSGAITFVKNNTAGADLRRAGPANSALVSTWNLTSAANTVEFNAQTFKFENFSQLIGGAGKDTFDYSATGSTVFVGKVDGAGGAEDTIKGFDADTSWDLTGATANFYRTADSSKKYNFTGIERLIGGNQKDVVTLATTITEVNLDAFSTGFSLENFEGIAATAATAKLTGYSGISTWAVTGDNAGTIVSGAQSTEFAGFKELVSSAAPNNKDTFNLTTGSLTSITGQAGDTLNTRSGASLTNDWVIDAAGNAQVAEKNGATSTVYINKISGVGTVNGSTGADNFSAQGTYTGNIIAGFSNAVADKNALTTASADIVFNASDYSANGIVGITEFNADGATAEIKASANLGAVHWGVTPGAAAGQLSGTVVGVAANKSLDFKNFAKLIGGSNSDEFTLGAGTFNGGTIDGGAINNSGSANSLINTTTSAVWDLAANTLRAVNFANIQTLNAFTGDSLKAGNANNSFTLDATSTRILSTNANNIATNYTLDNFKTLIGGDNNDAFKIDVDAADVALQGGKGDDTFTLGSELIKTKNLIGGEGSDTLSLSAGANIWTLTASQTGDVNTNTFSGMEILAGGVGADSLDNKIAGQTLNLSAINAGVLHASSDANIIAATISGMDSVNNLAVLEGFSGTSAWALNKDGEGSVKTATNTALNFTQVTKIQGGSGNETFLINKDVTEFALDGGSGTNTLQGADIANTWLLSPQNSGAGNQPVAHTGTLNGNGFFSAVQILKGGSLADSLDLTGTTDLGISLANISGIEELIGGTNSSLTGASQVNNWQLNVGASGVVNTVNFKDFTTLIGGSGQDVFTVANGAQFEGTINGGVNSSSTLRDELKIDSVAGTFTVATQGAGTLEFTNATNSTATKINFVEVETLTGGSAADKFNVDADVDMLLDGGTGIAVDTINLPNLDLDIALAVGAALPENNSLALANFEAIAANAASNSILRAVDGEATWAINEKNSGTLSLSKNAQTSWTEFTNFNHLVSGAGVDHFMFGDKGSIKTIDANDGDDLVGKVAPTRWDLTSQLSLTDSTQQSVYAESVTGLKRLTGGDGNDEFNLAAATTSAANNLVIEGGKGQNTLIGPAGNWNWILNASQKGELALAAQKTVFVNVQELTAGANQSLTNTAAVDAWRIATPNQIVAIIGNESTQINQFASVNTGAGDDELDINAAFGGTVNLGDGKNTVTLGAQGSIGALAAGSGIDSIASLYIQSLWTLTEENNRRFVRVTSEAGANKSIIGELTGFEAIKVTGFGNNSLASSLDANQWVISGTDSGSLAAPLVSAITFAGFNNLFGSDGADIFAFNTAVVFNGSIDGGKGENLVDVSTGGQKNYQIKESEALEINGVKNANGIKGAGAPGQLTLVSTRLANWEITAENKGSLTYGSDIAALKTIYFDAFGILMGGDGADTFTLKSGGSIEKIDGGLGQNSLHAPELNNTWQLGQDVAVKNTDSNALYVKSATHIEQFHGGRLEDIYTLSGAVVGIINAGDGDDRLTLEDAGSLDGIYDGGAGDNSLITARSDSLWALSDLTQGRVDDKNSAATLIDFKNVNQMQIAGANTASANATLSLAEINTSLAWQINASGGQVNPKTEQTNITRFNGFNTLVANQGDDDVTLSTALKSLDLGAGKNKLTLVEGAGLQDLIGGSDTDELVSFSRANLWQMLSATQGKLSAASADVVSQFTGVEQFTGSGSDTLTAAAGTNKWAINGPNSGTLNTTYKFSAFARAQGNTGSDTFTFGNTGSLEFVDGGEGEDSLIARNKINQWDFTANNSGSIHAPTDVNYVNFAAIENFTGASAADDTVTVSPQVSSVKLEAGGQAGDELIIQYRDSLNLASDGASWLGVTGVKKTTAQALTTQSAQLSSSATTLSSWRITEVNGGDWTNGALTTHFSGFDKLLGSAADDAFVLAGGRISTLIDGGTALNSEKQNDSLVGENFVTHWTISSTGSGSLVNEFNSSTQSFAGFETVQGGVSNDEFRLLADDITINLRGGNSTGLDSVIFNGALDITLGQQDVVGVGIAEIESFEADSTKQNTLRSSSVGGLWTLRGENSGTLVSGSETLNFSNVQNLRGGKGDDEFNLDETARVSGELSGGEGNNTLNLSHNSEITATLSDDGAGDLKNAQSIARFTQITNLNLSPVAANLIATLNGANQSNQWSVSDDKVQLNGRNYSGFTRLNGSDGSDNFDLSGKQTFSIDGKNGGDSLSIKSNDNTQVNWQITGAVGVVSVGTGGTSEIIAPQFANIERLTGGDGDDTFNLIGANTSNSRFDGAAGNNTLTARAANNQWRLGALLDDGSIALDHLNTAEVLNIQTFNGAGSDTLVSSDDKHLWQLSRGGNLSLTQSTSTHNRAITATGIGQIKGGQSQDNFVLVEAGIGSFARMEGGSEGSGTSNVSDSLDASALAADVQVRLDAIPDGNIIAPNQLVVSGLETLQLNSANRNTVFGAARVNRWEINNQGQALLSSDGAAIAISGLSDIKGGAITDTVVLGPDGFLTGTIDGGDGEDKLDYSSRKDDLTLNTQNIDASFKNIELVIGNAVSGRRAKLKVNQAASWQINSSQDQINAGQVIVDGGTTIAFSNFNQFEGSSSIDTFTLGAGVRADIVTQGGGDRILAALDNNTALNVFSPLSDSAQITLTANSPLRWQITGNGAGEAFLSNNTKAQVVFNGFKTLIGGNQNDEYVLSGSAEIDRLDAGAGTNSVFNNQRAAWWLLGGISQLKTQDGRLTVGAFSNVQNIYGFADRSDEIINNGSSSQWKINKDLTGCLLGGSDCALNFAQIARINSSDEGDQFVFSGGVPSISLNARGEHDELIFSGDQPISLTLGSQLGRSVVLAGFERISAPEAVKGSQLAVNSIAQDSVNWDLNSGTSAVSYAGQTTLFSNFDHLLGGAGNDVFTIRDVTQMPAIDGGLGSNSINSVQQQGNIFSLGQKGSVQKARQGKVSSGSLGESSNFSFANIDVVNALGLNDQVSSEGDEVRWDIGASIIVNGVQFNGVESFKGGLGSDYYAVAANAGGFAIEDNLVLGARNKLEITAALNEQLNWIIEGNGQGKVVSSATELGRSISFSGIGELKGGAGIDRLVLNGDNAIVALKSSGGEIVNASMGFDLAFDRVETLGKNGQIISPDVSDSLWTVEPGQINVSWWAGRASTSLGFNGFTHLVGNQLRQQLKVNDDLDVYLQQGAVQNSDGKKFQLTQFDTIVGDGTHAVSVHGIDTVSNRWLLTGAASGSVNNEDGTTPDLVFSNIQHLFGGSQNDRFVSSSQPFLGGIDGGAGNDRVDYSPLTEPYTVVIDKLDNFASIETLIGSQSVAFATAADNARWNLEGADRAEVAFNDGRSVTLENYGTLLGSEGADFFAVNLGPVKEQASTTIIKADGKDSVQLLKGEQAVGVEVLSVAKNGISITANNTSLVLGSPGELIDNLAAQRLDFKNSDARNATFRLNKGSQQLFANGLVTQVYFDNKVFINFASLFSGFNFQVSNEVFPDMQAEVEPIENTNPVVFEAITLYQTLDQSVTLPDDQRLEY